MIVLKQKDIQKNTKAYKDVFNYIDFPKTRGRFQGVYRIGDAYIGASVYVLNRIKQHYRSFIRDNHLLNTQGLYVHQNINVHNYIKECYESNSKIDVYFLSDNPNDEFDMKMKYIDTVPLSKGERYYHEGFFNSKNKKKNEV